MLDQRGAGGIDFRRSRDGDGALVLRECGEGKHTEQGEAKNHAEVNFTGWHSAQDDARQSGVVRRVIDPEDQQVLAGI